jgi:putative addiction module antidote
MRALKVTKIGNSSGVILPKEVLADLRVVQGDDLFIVKSGDGYTLVAYDPEFEAQLQAAAEGAKKYRNALKALAK